MKLIVTALMAFVTAASAQTMNRDGSFNYVPDASGRTPAGTSGPGVVHTQVMKGRVIAIGSPITRLVPVGRQCIGQEPQMYPAAAATVGAIAGGAIGSQLGGGRGGQAAATTAGVILGSQIAQAVNGQPCSTIFEQQILGYNYTAAYHYIQMQGVLRRQPQIGEEVEIIIHSTFYAGDR